MGPRFLACAAFSLLAAACAHAPTTPPVELRLIAFNDFHGYLEAPHAGLVVDGPQSAGTKSVPAGGVARLATAIDELKRSRPNHVVVAAGDLVSGSPFASSIFRDEPAVHALSASGLEISSVGNHEFDRGRDELLRLQRGGCAGPGTCFDGAFEGARFHWLAANVIDTSSGRPLMPPYEIRRFDGIAVAFVGLVLRATPQMVRPSGVRGLEFRDEADTVNALVPELRAKGVEAIVVLLHQGGRSSGAYDDAACPGFEGPVIDIVKRLDRAVDVVVSGHTHEAYLCRVDGRLVTSAGSYGRLLTAIDLTLDRGTRDVVAARAEQVVVAPDRFVPDARIAGYVSRVVARAADAGLRSVGEIEGRLTAVANAAGESSLGDLVADSQLAAVRAESGAVIAFMNPGGLRAPLAARRGDSVLTFADLYAVEPFGNPLVTMTLTGEQLMRLLEQQWREGPGGGARVLQVSAGMSYRWNGSRATGSRVVAGSVSIDGRPVEPGARYRIVVNSFLAEGGDGFTVLREGTDRVQGPLDVEALESYVRERPVRGAAPADRIGRADAPPS